MAASETLRAGRLAVCDDGRRRGTADVWRSLRVLATVRSMRHGSSPAPRAAGSDRRGDERACCALEARRIRRRARSGSGGLRRGGSENAYRCLAEDAARVQMPCERGLREREEACAGQQRARAPRRAGRLGGRSDRPSYTAGGTMMGHAACGMKCDGMGRERMGAVPMTRAARRPAARGRRPACARGAGGRAPCARQELGPTCPRSCRPPPGRAGAAGRGCPRSSPSSRARLPRGRW